MAMRPPTTPPTYAAQASNPVMAGGATPAAVPTSVSLDLPQSIQQLINAPAAGINEQALGNIPTGTVAQNPQFPVLDFRMQPSYEEGGMIGPGGMPVRPAGVQPQGGQEMNPQMVDMQVNDMLSKTQRLLRVFVLLLRQVFNQAK